MKKTFLLVGLIMAAKFAQAQVQIGYHYRIRTKDIIHYKGTDDKEVTKSVYPDPVLLGLSHRRALKANLIPDKKEMGKIKIDFWGFSKDGVTDKATYVNQTDLADNFYLQVEQRKTLTVAHFISIPYTTVELGVTTIPYKIRFGYQKNETLTVPNDATSNISGGVYLGKKWGKTRFYADNTTSNTIAFTASVFAGPSVVAISADNTFPKATVKSNELAISTGLAFQVSKNDFNIGLLIGKDLPTSDAIGSWYYAHRTWIGFGIGYKLAILNGGK
jgi:hypothetical protein